MLLYFLAYQDKGFGEVCSRPDLKYKGKNYNEIMQLIGLDFCIKMNQKCPTYLNNFLLITVVRKNII